jgi:hypothetical protein
MRPNFVFLTALALVLGSCLAEKVEDQAQNKLDLTQTADIETAFQWDQPQTIRGVWVHAFEESSFFPDRTTAPDPHHPLRFVQWIALDPVVARKLAQAPAYKHVGKEVVVRLEFTGRRTRDPVFVDCQGRASFGFVVDQLKKAEYLGLMGRFDEAKALSNRPVTVAITHKGSWGELEAEAVERCRKR